MTEGMTKPCVHGSPLQGFGFYGAGDLGPCPRLVWHAPLGLKNFIEWSRDQASIIPSFLSFFNLARLASWRFTNLTPASHV